jgi:hypothetical protein
MVTVFMRDQKAVETLHILAHESEPACNFLRAQSGVNKHTRVACNDQDRIPS